MNPFDSAPAYFLPRRSIGGFVAYIAIDEQATDAMEITKNPVQRGAAVTDHAYKKPSQLTINGLFGTDDAPLAETYQALLDLQASAQPFDVVTGKRAYRNMLFAVLVNVTDKQTEHSLALRCELEEIRIVDVEVVTVPERSKQADAGKTGATENAGKKSAQSQSGSGGQGGNDSRRRSALAALAGG